MLAELLAVLVIPALAGAIVGVLVAVGLRSRREDPHARRPHHGVIAFRPRAGGTR